MCDAACTAVYNHHYVNTATDYSMLLPTIATDIITDAVTTATDYSYYCYEYCATDVVTPDTVTVTKLHKHIYFVAVANNVAATTPATVGTITTTAINSTTIQYYSDYYCYCYRY